MGRFPGSYVLVTTAGLGILPILVSFCNNDSMIPGSSWIFVFPFFSIIFY